MSTVIPINQSHEFERVELSPELNKQLREMYDVIGIDELEQKLRASITEFKSSSKKGTGFRSLRMAIEAKLYAYMKNQGLSEQAIEEIIDKRVPSHTYIRNFYLGQNICINYMNTMALFFDIRFFVDNFELSS